MDRAKLKLIMWMFVFVILINSSLAAEISGIIRNEDGGPMPGVAVVIEGTEIGTATDNDGWFLLKNVAPGTHTLKITYLSTGLEIIANTDKEIEVIFTQITLPTIVINAERLELQPILRLSTPTTELYGNCFSCLSKPLDIIQGDILVVEGHESVYDNGDIREQIDPSFMKWYIGIPKSEFDEILARKDKWIYSDVNTMLRSFELNNPELFKRNTDQFDIQISSELQVGSYYAFLRIINPYDGLKEEITWHPFNLYPRDVSDEELAKEETRVSQISSYEGSFNPNNFPTTDQPQPQGTVAYNGRWVPPLVSSWSCQESDGFPGKSVYNNQAIPSSCKVGNEIKARDTCGCIVSGEFTTNCNSGFTHVAEYGCSNNCQEPLEIKECPSGTICASESGEGACKTPRFEDLEEMPGLEYSLINPQLPISSEHIAIALTDNDLINSALCNSLGVDISELEVVEQQLTGTASVVKQITGFFAKITGKQTAAARTYTATIGTSGYSTLANLEHPYLSIKGVNARFLDRNLGSALLKEFGYTEESVEDAISSSAPSFTAEGSELTIIKSPLGYVLSPTELLYEIALKNSRDRAVEYLGSVSDISSAMSALANSRNPEDFLGLRFLLVRTNENKFFKLNDNIYSVSRGTYLVPYSFNDNVDYKAVLDPTQEQDLKPYYDLPVNIPGVSYLVGSDEYVNIKFLTPSEGYYAIRDLPAQPELETLEKTFTYRHKVGDRVEYTANDLTFRIIPIEDPTSGRDYGGYKKGLYFVPEKNIIIMDNEYTTLRNLRRKPGANLISPLADAKIRYSFGFFEEVRKSLAENQRQEYRDSLRGWLEINVANPIIKSFTGPRLKGTKVFMAL